MRANLFKVYALQTSATTNLVDQEHLELDLALQRTSSQVEFVIENGRQTTLSRINKIVAILLAQV